MNEEHIKLKEDIESGRKPRKLKFLDGLAERGEGKRH